MDDYEFHEKQIDESMAKYRKSSYGSMQIETRIYTRRSSTSLICTISSWTKTLLRRKSIVTMGINSNCSMS